MKARIAIFLGVAAAALFSAGCHGQEPQASKGYNVNLSWVAPAASAGWAGCTATSPCVYAVYAETIAAGTTACDPSTSANWKEITTTATRPSATTYMDSSATGLNRCYNVETVQASQNSAPSNTVQLVVPGIPTAPAVSAPTSAQQSLLELPLLPIPEGSGELASLSLRLKVIAARR